MSDQYPTTIRQAGRTDCEWIGRFLRARWSATTVVVHGEIIDAAALPALVDANHRGLATYRWHGQDAALVTLNAVPAGMGTGSALIEALAARLQAEGCTRLWVTTTNDNLSALRFYQRRGFRLIRVRTGAVDAARKLKPAIPMIGEHGIAIHDELDLCRLLDPSWGPASCHDRRGTSADARVAEPRQKDPSRRRSSSSGVARA
jgi:GNAT superfamily N-acetyltransferase